MSGPCEPAYLDWLVLCRYRGVIALRSDAERLPHGPAYVDSCWEDSGPRRRAEPMPHCAEPPCGRPEYPWHEANTATAEIQPSSVSGLASGTAAR